MEKIGFIGLGAMGGRMAAHMVRRGLSVRGYDLAPTALQRFVRNGGHSAASAIEAATGSTLLVLMVHNAQQAEEILFGASPAVNELQQGATVWLASTVAPVAVRRLEAQVRKTGRLLLDGPVSGGATGAEAGTLTIMASGPQQAFEVALPAMQACSQRILRLGDAAGAASTVKAINQLLTASHIALTAEAVAFGEQAGLDPDLLIEAIGQSAGASRQFEKRAPRMAHGDHERQSTVDIFLKDLGIALEAAQSLDFPTPIAAAAHQVFKQAADAGWGSESDTRVIDIYRSNTKGH